jgi:hypothetical protein
MVSLVILPSESVATMLSFCDQLTEVIGKIEVSQSLALRESGSYSGLFFRENIS